jgi:hypothetical protein
MKQWWLHHHTSLPTFEDDADKDRVEDLTGRIPLLLRPLLESNAKTFSDQEPDFWTHRDLVAVKENIQKYADAIKGGTSASNYEV